MANPLKPMSGNLAGLSEADTGIGTDCKNARIWVINPNQSDNGYVSFTAMYFWNGPAYNTWAAEATASSRTVFPFRQLTYNFASDPDADFSLRKKCYTYLLSIPPYSGAFEQG